MILTLPVSNLISKDNYFLMPRIEALEYREPQPVLDNEIESLFHSDYGIVQKEFIDYFDSILDYLAENRIKMFSFDLGPAAEKVEIEDFYYIARSKLLSRDELYEKIQSRLSYIKSNFNGCIALENLNYFMPTAYNHVCEANFINDIIRKNKVFFVLDIAHAIVTSHNLGIDAYEYISSLPLERVREIHLSAPGIKDGQIRDLHGIPSAKEYELLNFIRSQLVGEPYLVVEYYKDFVKLQEIYKNLSKYYDKRRN